jgi:hypothetical protein
MTGPLEVKLTDGTVVRIIVTYDYPPIPDRRFDWSAVTDNYDLGSPQGTGATRHEAMADLVDQLEDAIEEIGA